MEDEEGERAYYDNVVEGQLDHEAYKEMKRRSYWYGPSGQEEIAAKGGPRTWKGQVWRRGMLLLTKLTGSQRKTKQTDTTSKR